MYADINTIHKINSRIRAGARLFLIIGCRLLVLGREKAAAAAGGRSRFPSAAHFITIAAATVGIK